jgi:hypothetical protein
MLHEMVEKEYIIYGKCLCNCYMRCVRKTSMALFWSGCLCECYMRDGAGGKISMTLFWSECLCKCYMMR